MIYTKTLLLPTDIWNRHAKKKKTTITINSDKTQFNVNDRKENGLYKGMTLIDLKTGKEKIIVRWYCPTGRKNYCALWIYSDEIYTSGTGSAGGYGYDRTSTAFENAIIHAGIEGFPRFGGSGCNNEALEWLGKILGIKKPHIVEFNA